MMRSSLQRRIVPLALLTLGCRGPGPTQFAPVAPTPWPSQADLEFAATPIPNLADLAHMVDSLRGLDPAEQARTAVAEGCIRLLAVGGHSFGFPGLSRDSIIEYRRLYEWAIMPHTGGMTVIVDGDSTHMHWQDAAVAFAEEYNRAIVALAPRRP